MSDPKNLLWLIPILPLVASLIIGFFGPRFLRRQSHWPCVLAIAAAFVVAFLVFLDVRAAVHGSGHETFAPSITYFPDNPWIQVGEPGQPFFLHVPFSLRAD